MIKDMPYHLVFVSGIIVVVGILLSALLINPYVVLYSSALATNKSGTSTNSSASSNDIPTAKSVYETGIMSLPAAVNGFIIYIPDEAHHPLTDNKTMSLRNAHYIPSNLVVPAAAAVVFVHGDPNHIHVEIIKDNTTGNVTWKTTPITHPGSSDIKVLAAGSYSVSDLKYAPMTGTIKVESNVHSNGNLIVGGFLCPTSSVVKYRADFAAAGFQILSEHNFVSKVVQKDIAGPTTLLIYSTTMPIQAALVKLKPLVASLPYL
ncbi:MAG: hypothetical protein M3P08_15690 [Thermoproteota archaeon]|nr:hypothetical protein [Thermoproteota archaeon]